MFWFYLWYINQKGTRIILPVTTKYWILTDLHLFVILKICRYIFILNTQWFIPRYIRPCASLLSYRTFSEWLSMSWACFLSSSTRSRLFFTPLISSCKDVIRAIVLIKYILTVSMTPYGQEWFTYINSSHISKMIHWENRLYLKC